MNSIKSIKIGVISAAAAFGLLAGGLLLGSSLAGAQTPPAQTPSPQTVPADPTPGTTPRNDGTTPRGDKECDEDRPAPSGSSSSSAPSGLRRSGAAEARF